MILNGSNFFVSLAFLVGGLEASLPVLFASRISAKSRKRPFWLNFLDAISASLSSYRRDKRLKRRGIVVQ